MPNLPFTLRQLELFESLASTRSFRRTADALGISQASVSNQIKALEEQLGVELFERKPGRRPVMCPEGLAFLDDLRQFNIAGQRLAAHRRTANQDLQQVKRFRVLVGQGMFDAYVRRKLDRFFARHPLIELEFETQLPFGKLMEAIESGAFDFALINRRVDHPVYPGLRDVAVVRGGVFGHRKFAKGHNLPLDRDILNTLPFILPKATSQQEREVMRNYELAGIRPRNIAGHTQYFDVIAAMLDRGIGVASFSDAILPPSMRKDVICLYPMPHWRLHYYRRDRSGDPRADIVENFLLSSLLDDPDFPAISRGDDKLGTKAPVESRA